VQLVITPEGNARCVYGEEINLHALGSLAIARASQVEPDQVGSWWADLSPVHGPKLGPFLQRTGALQAESNWLQSNWLLDKAA